MNNEATFKAAVATSILGTRKYLPETVEQIAPAIFDFYMKEALTPQKVIFHDPATIVFWGDGTKTVARRAKEDIFDPEVGIAMAFAKKAAGSGINLHKIFKQWIPEVPEHVIGKEKKEEPIAKPTETITETVEDDHDSKLNTDETYQIFDPERLATKMNEYNYSQSGLARQSGVPQSTISQYMRGVRIPTPYSLHKIAKALNVSSEYLLGTSDKSS